MSADSYDKCPICNGIRQSLKERLNNAYGKVPENEYNEIKEQVKASTDKTSVSVYYEITLLEVGQIKISLSAKCKICGAEWEKDVTI